MSAPWWKTRVFYQVYPRSFMDSTGDGNGDIRGITSKLEYLKQLGIGAIWFSPFFKSPQADGGYDVQDYTKIDPLYGTEADFDEMVKVAHELDIKVVLDLVLNHTSDQHEWFKEARKSRDNPKHDWYIWHPGPKAPNNWKCNFTLKSAWVYNKDTDECYLGQFTPTQPEVNWRNPELKEQMFEILRFWLRRGADGFRFDVADYYIKDEQLRSNPLMMTKPQYFFQNRMYNQDRDEVTDIFKEFR